MVVELFVFWNTPNNVFKVFHCWKVGWISVFSIYTLYMVIFSGVHQEVLSQNVPQMYNYIKYVESNLETSSFLVYFLGFVGGFIGNPADMVNVRLDMFKYLLTFMIEMTTHQCMMIKMLVTSTMQFWSQWRFFRYLKYPLVWCLMYLFCYLIIHSLIYSFVHWRLAVFFLGCKMMWSYQLKRGESG